MHVTQFYPSTHFYPSPSAHRHLKQQERTQLGPCQSVLATPHQSTIDGCANNGSIDNAGLSTDGADQSIAQFCAIDRSAPSIDLTTLSMGSLLAQPSILRFYSGKRYMRTHGKM